MKVLGISPLDKDASASLVEDGKILFAAGEERFSRQKQHAGFPYKAVEAALAATNTKPEEIEIVAYAFLTPEQETNSVIKSFARERDEVNGFRDHGLQERLAAAERRVPQRTRGIPGLSHPNRWMEKPWAYQTFYRLVGGSPLLSHYAERYAEKQRIKSTPRDHQHWATDLETGLRHFGLLDKLRRYEHHLSHAANSYLASGFERALVAVLHDVLFDFTFDASAVATASLCIAPRVLVSARLRPLRSVEQLRAAVRAGAGFRSPVALLAHLLRDQAGVLVDIVRQATQRVDHIEDRLLANRIAARRAELGSLRRVLVRLQRLLAPEPAALFRLLTQPPGWIVPDDRQDLQRSAEEFAAAVSDTVAVVERVKLVQEELVVLVNEQTNRTLFVLTMVTVLALPINLVAGLFGMNVGGVPLASHRHGFLIVVVILLLVTVLLAYVALGRRRE